MNTATEPRANGEAAHAGARRAREAKSEPTITLTVAQAERIRKALAASDFTLRQVEQTGAHRLSGAARTARSEIGAAVAHLDRATRPVAADVVAGVKHD